MAPRKKGTGQPLLEHEKLAIVRYCEDLKSENPNFLTKELCQYYNKNIPSSTFTGDVKLQRGSKVLKS
jgi:hypothetical protein